ncbi:MAG: hypothetical protein HUJ42_00295 [Malacoplasma sp.]|nr:hypothetical protein [Malacoplasma sp.]
MALAIIGLLAPFILAIFFILNNEFTWRSKIKKIQNVIDNPKTINILKKYITPVYLSNILWNYGVLTLLEIVLLIIYLTSNQTNLNINTDQQKLIFGLFFLFGFMLLSIVIVFFITRAILILNKLVKITSYFDREFVKSFLDEKLINNDLWVMFNSLAMQGLVVKKIATRMINPKFCSKEKDKYKYLCNLLNLFVFVLSYKIQCGFVDLSFKDDARVKEIHYLAKSFNEFVETIFK